MCWHLNENFQYDPDPAHASEVEVRFIAEGPSQTRVEVPHDFYLGAFPVTQEQWQAVMGSNPSWFARGGGGADKVKGIADADLKRFPVEQVSWNDCQAFLMELGQEERKFYRLPTEAEWEHACRAGTTTPFSCGEVIGTDLALVAHGGVRDPS